MTPNHHTEPIATQTPDLPEERLAVLRELFPDIFTEGKVDSSKLRAVVGDLADDIPERYTFNWAGKKDAIRLLQTPTRATLVPARGESVNFDTTQNLFIEGDNLEVLKLLYKPYFGRVKMIYIDPPYNTGNDFVYPDNYTDPLAAYLQTIGQMDVDGNDLTNKIDHAGRYHSAWLSMMYPRLFLARQLLRDDGVIFVSIDDHEMHNLRLAMNDIFGEENFIASICWERADSPKMDSEFFSVKHDYILCYAKSIDAFNVVRIAYQDDDIPDHFNRVDEAGRKYYLKPLRAMGGQGETRESRPGLYYPIATPDGTVVYPKLQGGGDGAWRWGQKKLERERSRIEWTKTGTEWTPYFRIYADESAGKPPETILFSKDVGSTRTATAELKSLFEESKYFDTPKPTKLLSFLILISTSPDDVVLDFFAGSCSTAQAVLELNRKDGGNRRFVMVQLQEPTGGKDFPTIADIGKERIRRVITRMKGEGKEQPQLDKVNDAEDLGFKVLKLGPSYFKPWVGVKNLTPEQYTDQMALYNDPLTDGWTIEGVIQEVALKEGYSLGCRVETLAEVTGQTVHRVTDPDREQSFVICLDDQITLVGLKSLHLAKDDLFVCRDSALDDEAAANLALQCRLKTI